MARTNSRIDLPASLALVQGRVAAVAKALLGGQPEELAAVARELQLAAVALSDALRGQVAGNMAQGRALRQALCDVAQNIAMQREACLRRTAAVERALNSIIPATRSSTYAGSASRYRHGGPGLSLRA